MVMTVPSNGRLPSTLGGSWRSAISDDAAPEAYPFNPVEYERLALAAKAGRVGIWDFNIDTGTLYCDDRWHEILGLTTDEPVTSLEAFKAHIHPDDVEFATKVDPSSISKLIADEQHYGAEFRIIRPMGEIRWVKSVAFLLERSAFSPARAIGAISDVTEARHAEHNLKDTVASLKSAEAALRELNATLETRVADRTRDVERAWSNSRDLQVIVGATGALQAVSSAWGPVLGYRPDEVAGRHFLDFVAPEDAVSVMEAYGRAVSGLDLTRFEARFLHKDGSPRWISWHSSVENGIVYGYGRDITEKKHAAETIERAEARLRAVFDASYQQQVILSLSGDVLDSNTAALKAIDAQLSDVVGMAFWDAPWFNASPEAAAFVRKAVASAAANQAVRHEAALEFKSSGRRWVDFTLRPIHGSSGQIVGLFYEAADLTDRRRAEEALRSAQRMEAVGQLASGIAHDFNNMLQGVVGPLDLARRRLVDGRTDAVGRYLDVAINAARKATALTQRLLAFSRGEAQGVEPICLSRAVSDILTLMRHLLPETITIEIKTDGEAWAVVDPSQLENALVNLCINAGHAMPDGGAITLAVSNITVDEASPLAKDLEVGKDYVLVEVTDTGSGMSPEVAARAFDPFFTTKAVGKGSGLGLSMVREFSRQAGGRLWLNSTIGAGTTVSMGFPRWADPLDS